MTLESNPELLKAAKKFAKAWAAWHNHAGLMLDEELIDASHGILAAINLQVVDDENINGKSVLAKVKE